MKTTITLILSIAAQLTAFGIAGTDIVVAEGKTMTEPEQVKWPAGVMSIVNDPARTVGWHPWFSELPNTQYLFAFDISGSADVNRLLKKLAAVRHEPVVLLISSDPGPGKTSPLVKEVESKIKDSALRFTIGSQALLDSWYERLEETETGVKKFGVTTYEKPPQALAPTLILFAGHPAVDLNQLIVPKKVAVVSVASAPNQEPDAKTLEEVNQFLKKHSSN